MNVSVIIPCLNSPIIMRVIDRLLAQDAHENIHEILVVGKDSTGQLETRDKVRYIDTGDPVGPSQARNIGIRESKQALVIFLDSDCLPRPDWLASHLQAHKAGHCIVGGGVCPSGDSYWKLTYNLALFHEFFTSLPLGRRDYLPTLNLSMRRQVFDRAGYFDETLARGQDIEMCVRLRKVGYTLQFWPAASVEHAHNRTSLRLVWKDCARSGFYMRLIRLQNNTWIHGPAWLKYRGLILVLSPLIATLVTTRIVATNPSVFLRLWWTLPGIFLTKIAWCWGASRKPEMTRSAPMATNTPR